MNRCYIAGRMRGVPEDNFPLFDKAAAVLRGAGWDVISPAELDRKAGFDPAKMAFTPDIIRQIARRDSEAVLSLEGDRGDALVIIDEWDKSVGTHAEVGLARMVKLPAFRLHLYPDGGFWLEPTDISLKGCGDE